MKTPRLPLLAFTLLTFRAVALAPTPDPQADVLVDCGAGKVATFEDTASPDGKLAPG